ncbi:MAG: amino acid ABC transporter permease [Mycobacteriaceae bacterium]
MTNRASVLYDTPGPVTLRRNKIISIISLLALALVLAYVTLALADKGQLTSQKWHPLIESNFWATYILPGLQGTIVAAALSIIASLTFGAIFGVARLSDHRFIRGISGFVVEIFRSTPVLILMIFLYQAFALYSAIPPSFLTLTAVVVALTLYNGSVMAEIVRSGIQSLSSGQSEAASALGLRKSQIMRIILLPQAVSVMLPALVSQMVVALKDSALGYVIGYVEVVRSGRLAGVNYRNVFVSLIIVAIIMIVINLALSTFATWLERRLKTRRTQGTTIIPDAAQPKGDTDTGIFSAIAASHAPASAVDGPGTAIHPN